MTDTPQDPNYQDILTKYADSLKSTEVPKIPEPVVESQLDPQTQLDSVPAPKVEAAPSAPPTVLEPDPLAQMIPETEPQTAIMTEADGKVDENPVITEAPTESETVQIPAPIEAEPEAPVAADPETQTEAPTIIQPDVQIPPSMMETTNEIPVESDLPTSSDGFVPPAPHPIEIAPDFVPPKENHFFKYLFFFSLFVFLVVLGSIVYTFINSQKTTTSSKAVPTVLSPTEAPATVCEINGQKYNIGQSFSATDGCNTCSCTDKLEIVCTEMACESSNSASPTTSSKTTMSTKSATDSGAPAASVSATKTPTKKTIDISP